MPVGSSARLLICAAAALWLLAGCASSGSSAEAPEGVSLAGSWKIDHATSDDPQKTLDKMRAEAFKMIRRAQGTPDSGPGPAVAGGAVPPPQGGGPPGPSGASAPHAGPHPDPLSRSPMAHIIEATIARGDFLTVRQMPTRVSFDYGTSQRSYTPGEHSVVSAEGGVADQTCGWKGKEFVIHIKAQMGPEVTESYARSGDGKQLIAKLHIGAAELPAVTLTRIYNPTDEAAPRQLPVSD